MVKCSNPKCGEINEKGRESMICRKCGYVMLPFEKPKEKRQPEKRAFDFNKEIDDGS